jgi:L-alanine-DL-glutamate epimerase-like enolase superfamily enzyme
MMGCQHAAAAGVPVCLHAWSAGVGIAQNLHVAWAAPNAMAIEWPISHHPTQTQPLSKLVQFRSGYLLPADAPGLGVEVSDGLIAGYPCQDHRDRDF